MKKIESKLITQVLDLDDLTLIFQEYFKVKTDIKITTFKCGEHCGEPEDIDQNHGIIITYELCQ